MEILTSLNDQQKKAVRYVRGPLLVVAGAGTGKTFMIVEKIKYLIKKGLAKPDEIVALTFTEKAAAEMEERVDKILPYGYSNVNISTFHSFADQILRREIHHIGMSPSYKLMTKAETLIFIRDNLFLFKLKYFRPLGNPHKFLEALHQHFSRLRDEDISPNEYLRFVNKKRITKDYPQEEREKIAELASAYDLYQKLKLKENVFDFEDLLYYFLTLLRKRSSVLSAYQRQFKYVFVDEFQDTNIAQYETIKLLCPPKNKPKLTVVGDDSQAIYKFRGASVSNILAFMKDYPMAKQVTMNLNYRSNQTILDAAYKLIQNNNPDTLESKLGISKKLIASTKKKDEDSVRFYFDNTVEQEADFVSQEIIKLKKDRHYSDFALLVRANNHADAFARSFYRHGIPYQFLGPGMLFKQPEIKELIAYLMFLANIEDSPALYRVITMDVFDIYARDISYLLSFAKKISRSLFEGVEIFVSQTNKEMFSEEYNLYKPYLPTISADSQKKLLALYTMIKRHLGLLRKETAGQILYFFLEDSGMLGKIIAYQSEREEKIALNISKFFEKLKQFETTHENASVFAAVDFLKMSMELGESPISPETDAISYDAVTLLTAHSAKGLEFPVVFIGNATKARFPTNERKEPIPIPDECIKEILPQGNAHLLEERRLFYVALTRAMDIVYLTGSRLYEGGKREQKISPFVIETIGEDTIQREIMIKKEEKKQLSIFDFKKKEEPIIRKHASIHTFSFSQLECFSNCPLQYKYTYVLKVPTQTSPQLSFGNTIHKTLQFFCQEYLKNPAVTRKDLLALYEKAWVPIGYGSQAYEKNMKQEGKHMLTDFFIDFHKHAVSITALEKKFKIKIPPDIFIVGKIDRVDKKGNKEIEIIDYKTGKKPSDKELKNSLQLSMYAIAATDKGLFNTPLDKVRLSFYYLQNKEIYSMKKTDNELEAVKDTIRAMVGKINENIYPPKKGKICNHCPFRIICEAWQ